MGEEGVPVTKPSGMVVCVTCTAPWMPMPWSMLAMICMQGHQACSALVCWLCMHTHLTGQHTVYGRLCM